MFGRSDRFNGIGDSTLGPPKVEYLSFSDFIRQQFLKQRNIFDSSVERPKSASACGKVEKFLQSQYINTLKPKNASENISGDSQNPRRPQTAGESRSSSKDNKLSINTSLLYQEPETEYGSPPRPKKKHQHHTVRAPSNRLSQVAVGNDNNLTNSSTHKGAVIRNGVDINPATPGPGQYHQPISLVKPSFNRVYTEPEPALPLNKAANLARTFNLANSKQNLEKDVSNNCQSSQQRMGANDERVEYRPAWDQSPASTPNRTMTEDEKARVWETYKGAYFNKAKFRLKSAPPSLSHSRSGASVGTHKRNAWGDGSEDDMLKETFPLTFKVKDPNLILSDDDSMMDSNFKTHSKYASPQSKVAKKNEVLYGKRYPALSDDQMKRWESVDHTTYDNKSKQKLPIAMRLVAGKVANRTKKNHFC